MRGKRERDVLEYTNVNLFVYDIEIDILQNALLSIPSNLVAMSRKFLIHPFHIQKSIFYMEGLQRIFYAHLNILLQSVNLCHFVHIKDLN